MHQNLKKYVLCVEHNFKSTFPILYENSSPEKLKQDDNLSLILEDLRGYFQMIKEKN